MENQALQALWSSLVIQHLSRIYIFILEKLSFASLAKFPKYSTFGTVLLENQALQTLRSSLAVQLLALVNKLILENQPLSALWSPLDIRHLALIIRI